MLWKIFRLNTTFLLIFLLTYCTKNITPTETLGPVKIEKITPEIIHPFDIITIYGSSFGIKSDSTFLLLDSLKIPSLSCIKWNNSFIQLRAEKNFKKGNLRVVNGSDTSKPYVFQFYSYPKIEFVNIPSGTFYMGSNTGLGYEQPVHKVTITYNFLISIHEITQKQWLTVMDTNPSPFVGLNLPVSNVDWFDAILFCNKLSKIRGLDTCYIILDSNTVVFDTIAKGFRLPTEAEWEYACRAGTTGDFSGTGNPYDMGWFDVNSGMKPHPVGQKQANNWGIYDMHGNVWEWCWDWFDPFYYEKSPSVNPRGPNDGMNRVVRGGSWQRGTIFGRSSSRQFPEDQKLNFGFRIVRTI
ncbi:MAG: formylglycine-generating enzyme family protein [Ignavibacteria bacterium]|nr:formylglycine-generating enzyme family protein [Ignavibacteria bacterium]